jgi:hypothetical protein
MSSPTQSDYRVDHETEGGAPGVESWVKVALAAFVPLVLAFYLPSVLQPYLFVIGALLVVWSIVMLVRQQRADDSEPLA